MSGFKVNFSVNNQLSTPSIHAAPFAQRPAAGQPGRVFIDSDNPSTGIYRDTGTTWVAIGNPSSPDVDTLQIVTDRGNTTTNSITVGAATTPSGTVDVRRSTAALNGTNDWAFLGVNTPTIPSGASFGVNYVNAVYGSQAQTFAGNATIGNAGLNSAGNFINTLGNSASGTITVAQGSGTIRAIAGLHAGIYYNTPNAMTFTHVAGIRTLQPINSGAVGASVTNYYGIHVADSTPATGTISYTNRYGIYQEGASDINFFQGITGFGTNNPNSSLGGTLGISINYSGSTNGLAINAGGSSNVILVQTASNQFYFYSGGTGGRVATMFNTTGNWLIGTGSTDAGYKLDIRGQTYIDVGVGTNPILRMRTNNATNGWFYGNGSSALTWNQNFAIDGTLTIGNGISTANGRSYDFNVGTFNNVSVINMTNSATITLRPDLNVTGTKQGAYIYPTNDTFDEGVIQVWNAAETSCRFIVKSLGQVGIGTNNPVSSALLQMDSTTKGFLGLPRMTDAQITGIATPANGLMAYSTDQNCPAFYDGTGWRKISHSAL